MKTGESGVTLWSGSAWQLSWWCPAGRMGQEAEKKTDQRKLPASFLYRRIRHSWKWLLERLYQPWQPCSV